MKGGFLVSDELVMTHREMHLVKSNHLQINEIK